MKGADCVTYPVESRSVKLIHVPNIDQSAIIRKVVYVALTSCKVDIPKVGSTICREKHLKRLGSRISARANTPLGSVVVSKPYIKKSISVMVKP